MALQGKIISHIDEGKEVKVFQAEFTNGTIEQLKELATYLDKEGFDLPSDEEGRLKYVVEIGIAWLERLRKNDKEKVEEK